MSIKIATIQPRMGHSPRFLQGVSVKRPDMKQVMESYCRMLYVIGSYASVVQGKAKDLCAELMEHPDLFRHEVKKNTKAALNACEGMVRHISSLADADGQLCDWLDITDRMEQSVETDMVKLYFTIDNVVHRTHFEPHRVATLSVMAVNLAHQMVSVVETCGEILGEMAPGLRMSGDLGSSSRGIRDRLQNVIWKLVPVEVFSECKKSIPVRQGFDIVYAKLANLHAVDDMAEEQAKLYGVMFREEDQIPGCNNGKAWTEFHDKVLRCDYGRYPDEKVAAWLGRSVCAIRARAQFLKLKKRQSMEERLCMERESRKQKQNNTKKNKSYDKRRTAAGAAQTE